MKICIVTAKTPFSCKESFILDEILALNKIADVLVVPRDVRQPRVSESKNLDVLVAPLFSLEIFAYFFGQLFTKEMRQILRIIFRAQNKRTILKNLAVLPKAVTLAKKFESRKIAHIHAHWGGTTSSMALFVHILTKIPFSVTLHRWDIAENNLLVEKTAAATFVRTISESGLLAVKEMLPANLAKRVFTLHMGVKVPKDIPVKKGNAILKIVNVGNLVQEKDQETFLRALNILKNQKVKFQADIFGDGPLKNQLVALTEQLGLSKNVKFFGHIAHAKLLKKYSLGEYDLMVMTSIIEGVPVALLEAMAYGIPAIATEAGGISELIEDKKTGLLTYDRSPKGIAQLITSFLEQPELHTEMTQNAKKKTSKYFNISATAKELLNKMS